MWLGARVPRLRGSPPPPFPNACVYTRLNYRQTEAACPLT